MIQSLKRLPRARLHHQPDKTRHNQIVCTQTPAFRFAGPFHLGVSFLGGFLFGACCQRETKGHSPMFEVPPPKKKKAFASPGKVNQSNHGSSMLSTARPGMRRECRLLFQCTPVGYFLFVCGFPLKVNIHIKGRPLSIYGQRALANGVCVHIVWVHHCWLICSEGKETIKGVLSC